MSGEIEQLSAQTNLLMERLVSISSSLSSTNFVTQARDKPDAWVTEFVFDNELEKLTKRSMSRFVWADSCSILLLMSLPSSLSTRR